MKKVRGVIRPQNLQNKNSGGVLVGPSHEQGGISAIVGGNDPVELEGGEYIINAQTVNAIGQPFLDKLNSTQTEYHTGGYDQGQLPNPSYFNRGGRVVKNRKLQGGGSVQGGIVYPPPSRRRLPSQMQREAPGAKPCPRGMYSWKNACFQITGDPDKLRFG